MWSFLERMNSHKQIMVGADEALPGRDSYPFPLTRRHAVLGTDMLGPHAPVEPTPWPEGAQAILLAGGCFWGIERIAWQLDGVHTTAAVYAGGFTDHPTYEEVCTARTGHAEAVLVVYTGGEQTLARILTAFWEQHDPTTAARQGNDIGTQYRSAVLWTDPSQEQLVRTGRDAYQQALADAGRGQITTELLPLEQAGSGRWFYAEPEHQQYLHHHPGGYCNHGFNGVSCRIA